jgi:hypothetical protein
VFGGKTHDTSANALPFFSCICWHQSKSHLILRSYRDVRLMHLPRALAVVPSSPRNALAPGWVAFFLPFDPAPTVAFLDGTYEPAAGSVKLPRPLSASGSLRPFA